MEYRTTHRFLFLCYGLEKMWVIIYMVNYNNPEVSLFYLLFGCKVFHSSIRSWHKQGNFWSQLDLPNHDFFAILVNILQYSGALHSTSKFCLTLESLAVILNPQLIIIVIPINSTIKKYFSVIIIKVKAAFNLSVV